MQGLEQSRAVMWEVRAPRMQSGDGHGGKGQDWGKETGRRKWHRVLVRDGEA